MITYGFWPLFQLVKIILNLNIGSSIPACFVPTANFTRTLKHISAALYNSIVMKFSLSSKLSYLQRSPGPESRSGGAWGCFLSISCYFTYDVFPCSALCVVDVFYLRAQTLPVCWCPWNVVIPQAAFCCFTGAPQSQCWGHRRPCWVLFLLDTGVMGAGALTCHMKNSGWWFIGFPSLLYTSLKSSDSAESMRFGRTMEWPAVTSHHHQRLVHGSGTRIMALHLVFP